MPKDDGTSNAPPPPLPPLPQQHGPQHGPHGTHPPPLKRGDACLYCRRRRIRCNAAKPACQNCTKLRRECVYDTGKPVSRVRMLEDRVAELEGYLRAAGAGNNGGNSGNGGGSASGTGGGGGSASGAGHAGSINEPPPAASTREIDWDSLDPALLSLVAELSGTTTNNAPSASSAQRLPTRQRTALQQHLADIPPQLGHVVQRVPVPAPAPVPGQGGAVPITSRTPQSLSLQEVPAAFGVVPAPAPALGQDPLGGDRGSVGSGSASGSVSGGGSSHGGHGHGSHGPGSHGHRHAAPSAQGADDPYAGYMPYAERTLAPPTPTPADAPPPPETLRPQLGFTLSGTPVGGWWDPNDLPPETRDHLLEGFFNGLKLFKIFHIPRFMASLTLPPSKRPHPCLLYAMYLSAASRSPNPNLKALESHFLTIAITRLNESVSALDRLLDATRAATILAVYRFQKNQYQAGIMMTAQAVQLALTLGLHQITSSVWRPPRGTGQGEPQNSGAGGGRPAPPSMRMRQWMIGPPKDAIELGERINAFWALFAVDRSSAIASQWPTNIPADDILTPYPRPIYEYEMGLVSFKDDYSLRSMWDTARPRHVLPHHTLASHHILFLRSLALLERASKLMYLPDEPGAVFPIEQCDFEHAYNSILFDVDAFLEESNAILSSNLPPVTSAAFDASRTPSVRTPKAYEAVRTGLLSVEADLPPHQRTNWEVPIEQDPTRGWWEYEIWSSETASVINMLGIAWMFLFDVYAPYADNTRAVNVARRLARNVRAKPARLYRSSEEDLIITVCWSFVSMVLVRELRRQHMLGDMARAVVIKADLDSVVEALKLIGVMNQAAANWVPPGTTPTPDSSGSGSSESASGPGSAAPTGPAGPGGPGVSGSTMPGSASAAGPSGVMGSASAGTSGHATPSDLEAPDLAEVVFNCRTTTINRDRAGGQAEAADAVLLEDVLDLELELDM